MASTPHVIHIKQQHNHAVCVAALRVIISEGDGGWYAEGVEIDYAAFGQTIEEVQLNFELGFIRTIHLHIAKFGNLNKFIKWAPQSVLEKLPQSKPYKIDTFSTHNIEVESVLPISSINYLQLSVA